MAGGGAWLAGWRHLAGGCWIAGTVVAIVPASAWVVAGLRRKRGGVDIIALLSLVGSVLVGEYLAGALIAVVLASGRALDAAAGRRAEHDLRYLLERAPRSARRRLGSLVSVIPLADVGIGDVLVVGPGEVVPVDGRVADVVAVLDESALTGESLHVERRLGEPVRSGVLNAGSPFELRATAPADQSTYAGIVRLAQQAAESALLVRLADRYATWFLPLALSLAGLAWLLSGSAVRAVAVLVVATPCPLLLAAPAAIVSGLSRASREDVVIRGGGVLENLGRAKTLVMDKTGTLTTGQPTVLDVVAGPGSDTASVLRLAASVDQFSPHVMGEASVTEALSRGLQLSLPTEVSEDPGVSVTATVDGRRVSVGKLPTNAAIDAWARTVLNRARLDGSAIAWVCTENRAIGAVFLRVRSAARRHVTVRRLREVGLDRLILLTGDRLEPTREIATDLGLDAVLAEQTPADKYAAVRAESERAPIATPTVAPAKAGASLDSITDHHRGPRRIAVQSAIRAVAQQSDGVAELVVLGREALQQVFGAGRLMPY